MKCLSGLLLFCLCSALGVGTSRAQLAVAQNTANGQNTETLETPADNSGATNPNNVAQPNTNYTVSGSKIFTVYGERLEIRSAIASLADDIVRDMEKLLSQPQKAGRFPVIITLHGQVGEVITHSGIRQQLQQIGDRYLLQLHVHLGKGFRREELSYECLELLLHRKALEPLDSIPEDIVLKAPPWLVQGLIEASLWKEGKAGREKYETLRNSPQLFGAERLLNLEKSDLNQLRGPSRALFEASAGAMVLGLLEQKGGVDQVIKLLAEVSRFEGETQDLLYQYFPTLNTGAQGIEKWWNLQVANMALPKLTDVYDISETETQLQDILYLYIRDELGQLKRKSLSEYKSLIAMEPRDRLEAMESVKTELIRLNYRCFPLHRPIIAEYLALISAWQQGEDTDSSTRLDRLKKERELMGIAAARSRDYLDWYIISNAREVKGDFRNYQNFKQQIEKEREILKDELIDPYLDQMQMIWQQRKSQR